MIKKVLKFHFIFWLIGVLFIFIAFLSKDQTIDINIHDIYFVIAKPQLYILIAIYFGIVGLLYRLSTILKKHPIKWLTIMYVICMVAGISGFIIIPLFGLRNVYYTNTAFPYNYNTYIICIALAQLVLFINILFTILKKSARGLS